MQSNFANQKIIIAEGVENTLDEVQNKTLTWADFMLKLSKPLVSGEDHAQFLKLPKKERSRLKSLGGWIVAGEFSGTLRITKNLMNRSLVAIDCEKMPPNLFKKLKDGTSPLCKHEFYAHTTRGHTKDAPRVRIFLLCDSPIKPVKFEAVARILANQADNTMQGVDPVSFRPNQMMFYPSISKNQDFQHWHNSGKMINAEQILTDHDAGEKGRWKDHDTLPRHEDSTPTHKGDTIPRDPRTKNYWIGAFCRVFTIEQAIAEFLDGIYTKGSGRGAKPRFTYISGETTNGFVVEGGGVWGFSHHSSDPCSQILVNAWDLVRIHLFGAGDKNIAPNTPPWEYPSYIAMQKMAMGLSDVMVEATADSIDADAMEADSQRPFKKSDIFGGEDEQITAGDRAYNQSMKGRKRPDKDWIAKTLTKDGKANIKCEFMNIAKIIGYDPRFYGCFWRNEFTKKLVIRRDVLTKLDMIPSIFVKDRINGDECTSDSDLIVEAILGSPAGEGNAGWGLENIGGKIYKGLAMVGINWKFNPVIEYLESLEWDGEERAERLWIDYLGAEDSAYTRETALLFLMAVVCRAYAPGCQWDYVPIIQGKTGIRKSSFIRALFGEDWAGNLTAGLEVSKNSIEQMSGKIVLELPDLIGFTADKINFIKSFITFRVDRVRLTYEKRAEDFPRQCIFVGTTEDPEYLNDPNSNRRFWPIATTITLIDTDKVAENRHQIMAEVVQKCAKLAAQAGGYGKIKLTLSPEAEIQAQHAQELARKETGTQDAQAIVASWLNDPIKLSEINIDAWKDNEGNEDMLVIRTTASPYECAVEEFNQKPEESLTKHGKSGEVGALMRKVPGWKRTNKRRRLNKKYKAISTIYERTDATPAELKQGWRPMPKEKPRLS